MTTQAYETDGHGDIRPVERQLPPLGPRDVLLEVAAVSLNFRDLPFIRGNATRPASPGRIPMSDAVGRVKEVGSAVRRVRIGDRVSPSVLPNWLDGPLSEAGFAGAFASASRDGFLSRLVVVEEACLVVVSDDLTDVEAAALPCAALTAWHALVEIQAIQAGGTVVIESTGGVATFALQIAVARGIKAIVVSRTDEKLTRARALGAWETINSVQNPQWDEQVLALTGGRGAELVLDMGLTDGLPRSCRAAAFEGTVGIIGVVNGWQTRFDVRPVMNKNLRVRGVETGSRAMFERMHAFFAQRGIHPVISSVFGFTEPEAALEALGKSPLGKVVIDFEVRQESGTGAVLEP